MNRQVVPSMVLSVLIVCFFAVVLFPLERDRRQVEKSGVAPIAAGPPGAPGAKAPPPPVSSVASEPPAPRTVAAASAGPAPEPKAPPAEPSRVLKAAEPSPLAAKPPSESNEPVRIEAPPSPTTVQTVSVRSEIVPAPEVAPEPPSLRDEAPLAASTPVPLFPVHDFTTTSPEPVAASPAPSEKSVEAPASSRSERVSIPRADPEATVVEPGETLDDVSVRVYGTRAGVATLLRANREVLSSRKAPLRAGLQLWTPTR